MIISNGFGLWLRILLLLWALPVAAGSNQDVVTVNIPAGDAAIVLRDFAHRHDLEIIYSARILAGVNTKAVTGRFTPFQALARMLAGTGLEVYRDSKSSALLVREKKPSWASEEPTRTTTETMRNKNPIRTFFGGLLLALAPQLNSQEPNQESTIEELSPFVIEESQNVGYLASSTLAGTRIRTNLSDIGSSISVITQEVFEDTGATDAETILPYMLNIEVAGVQGNFADVSFAGLNRVRSNSTAQNSQRATRVRGLASAELSRGFFRTDIPFDSYNTSVVTINRGPNSLLFGASTPGGIIDQSLNQAKFSEDFGSLQVRVGERESHREVLDYNKIIIKDRLALRLTFLNDDLNYQQKPTFKHDTRAYAALNAVIFEGNKQSILGKTSIRGNFELGEVDSNPPKITPPGDGISDWFEAPSRDLEQYTGTIFPDWVDTFTPKPLLDNRSTNFSPTNLPFSGTYAWFINMPYVYHQPDLDTPSLNLPGRPEVAGIPARTLWRGVNGWGRFDTFGTTSFFQTNDQSPAPGFTVPTLNDRRIFDNQNMAIAGTLPYRNFEFDASTITIEQVILNGNGGIELSFDKQNYENEFYDPFGGGRGNQSRGFDLRVDVMEYLGNFQPNPNVGRVYMADFTTPTLWNKVERDSSRATGFYQFDFRDNPGWLRWLGRNVFTGFYNKNTTDRENRRRQNKWVDAPGSEFQIAEIVNDRLNGERRNAPIQVYLSDVLLGDDIKSVSDVRIPQYISVPRPQPGDILTHNFHPFFQSPANTTGPAAPMREGQFQLYESLTSGSARREIEEGLGLSWQSFLFGGNLVGLFGWREDKFTTIENISLKNFLNEFPDANGDGLLDSGEFDSRRIRIADKSNPEHSGEISSVSNETLTWSLVAHLPDELIQLPLGMRLSAHYNESESFVPTRTRRDFDGNVLPPETGNTKETGFTVELFDRKLSIRLNWFELEQNLATADVSLQAPFVSGLRTWKDAEILGIPFEEALLVGRDTRPALTPDITSYEEMYSAIIGINPQRQQDLFNIRFGPDGRQVLVDENPGQSVTTNAAAEGFELDIVGNLTDNWRILFNWGQQETITTDTAPVAAKFIFEVEENIRSSGLAEVTTAPSLGEFNPFINFWTNVNINPLIAAQAKDGTVSLEQRKHRINLVSTYSFLSDSRLKGLTIGGGIRWQSEIATGYETEVNSDGVITPIISRPFFGPEQLNGDAWLAYERTLEVFDAPIDWKIQLNVRNLIGDDDYIPVVTNPNGEVAVVRNPPTREWFLTNTFSF